MGYSTTFRLKGELDSKFQPLYRKEPTKQEIQRYKSALLALCMNEIPENKRSNYFELIRVFDNLWVGVQSCVLTFKEIWKYRLKSRIENNEIDFYGWEYSDDRDISLWDDEDDLVAFHTNDLFEIVIVPASSRFDKESESYYEKLSQINNVINSLEESVDSLMDQQFFEFYRDSDKADESDGYNRHFPEEVDETSKDSLSDSENKNVVQ